METNGGVLNSGDKSSNRGPLVGGEASILRSNLLLDHVGEVILTLTPDGLSWKPPDSSDCVGSTCLRIKFGPTIATELKFSDIYAVELIEAGTRQSLKLLSAGECCLGNAWFDSEMNSFTVHSYQKRSQPCIWTPAMNTFGHKDLQTCQMWVNRINDALNKEVGRPKKLLVFVHPLSGKANGKKTWDTVSPIFSRAKIDTKVTVTQRAGHAFDVMRSATNEELNSYDGAVAVGGDGFFNEILNGFLSSRHKAPLPPAPSDFLDALGNDASSLVHDPNGALSETHYNEESHPLLRCSAYNESGFSCLGTNDASPCIDPESGFSLPNQKFRFGIIPAGSTDAIVMCTTGARDPITSALHIVLGKRVCLDVAQVVRWKTTSTSKVEPCVRYAASFAGYGFYGDVITESEKYRWMGPKRYDYAGTKVFLRHRSYEAEVAYVDVDSGKTNPNPDESGLLSKVWSLNWKKTERIICRANCKVCNKKPDSSNTRSPHGTPYTHPRERQWSRSKGRFLSIGAAIISNRNERAPDGLVADAHLSDGFLHLLLIKDCPHALYLWHLTQLARKGGNPLNFDFVEHYKTPAFTFTSFGNESVWNLDGEPFQAHELSAQVFRGLVSLFATGPEV